MKESVLSLKENNTKLVFLISNFPQVLTIFFDWPVEYYFWRNRNMINGLYNPGQLFIYSTKALFRKLF